MKDLAKAITSFVLVVLVVLSIRWLFVEPFVIPSGSMIPNLLVNDYIVVNKFSYGVRYPFTQNWFWKRKLPKRGEVVVFKSFEDVHYIKRVVALEGDEISVSKDGHVSLNERDFKYNNLDIMGSKFKETVEPNADLELLYENAESNEAQGLVGNNRVIQLRKYLERMPFDKFKVPKGHIFVMGDNRDNSHDSRAWGALPLNQIMGKALFVWLSCSKPLPNTANICDPMKIRWSRLFHWIE